MFSDDLRVLHTADLHLDRSFTSWGSAGAVRRQDLLDTLLEIGDVARRERVHLLLMAGDQFDRHNPSRQSVEQFRNWLGQLHSDGITVAMISGNHDSYWYADSVYRLAFDEHTIFFSEASCESPVDVSINGIPVYLYGIAHDHTRHRDVLPGFRRRADDGIHIGLLHATVDPPPSFNVIDRYLPLESGDLRATGLDYIALGHLHRSRVIIPNGPGMAAYAGSPEPLTADEYGQRSVTLITFSGGQSKLETIACGKRNAERAEIDCTGLSQADVIERIEWFGDDSLILTTLLTGAPDELIDVEVVQDRTEQRFCYLVVSDQTSVVDTRFVRDIEAEKTIRGEFVRRLRAQVEQASTERERERASLALRLGLIQLEKRSIA